MKWKTTLAATVLVNKAQRSKVHAAGACYASPATAASNGGRAIKRDFAPINRRVALAILTHMLSNLC